MASNKLPHHSPLEYSNSFYKFTARDIASCTIFILSKYSSWVASLTLISKESYSKTNLYTLFNLSQHLNYQNFKWNLITQKVCHRNVKNYLKYRPAAHTLAAWVVNIDERPKFEPTSFVIKQDWHIASLGDINVLILLFQSAGMSGAYIGNSVSGLGFLCY